MATKRTKFDNWQRQVEKVDAKAEQRPEPEESKKKQPPVVPPSCLMSLRN